MSTHGMQHMFRLVWVHIYPENKFLFINAFLWAENVHNLYRNHATTLKNQAKVIKYWMSCEKRVTFAIVYKRRGQSIKKNWIFLFYWLLFEFKCRSMWNCKRDAFICEPVLLIGNSIVAYSNGIRFYSSNSIRNVSFDVDLVQGINWNDFFDLRFVALLQNESSKLNSNAYS